MADAGRMSVNGGLVRDRAQVAAVSRVEADAVAVVLERVADAVVHRGPATLLALGARGDSLGDLDAVDHGSIAAVGGAGERESRARAGRDERVRRGVDPLHVGAGGSASGGVV